MLTFWNLSRCGSVFKFVRRGQRRASQRELATLKIDPEKHVILNDYFYGTLVLQKDKIYMAYNNHKSHWGTLLLEAYDYL